MMTSAKCSRYALLRLAGTLPALIGLLCAFSFTSRAAVIRTQDATNSLHTATPAPGQPAEKGRAMLMIATRFPQGLSDTEGRLAGAKLRAIATGEEIVADEKGTVRLEAAPGTVYEITSPGYEPVLYTVEKGEAASIIMLQPERTEKKEPAVYVRDEYGVKQRPLYIVDGRERPNEELEGIDASHVADMKILKGDEAVAKYGERARYGAFVVTTTDGRSPSADATEASGSASETVGTTGDTDDEVYLSAETMPRFRDGELNEYVQWVAEQIILPEGVAPKGRAAASFVVGKEGTIRDIRILASPDQRLSKEVIRVIDASSGMWTPGMQDGKRVSVRYTIPVKLDAASEANEVQPTTASGTETEAQPDAGNKIPMLVEQMPAFEGGGIVAFRQWVLTNLRYPEAALKKSVRGKVIVSFVVESDGNVAQAEILQTPDRVLGDEVLRVVKKSPRWEPGREKGEAVAVELILPVVFNISDGTPPAVPAGKSPDPGSIAPIVVTAFPTEE